jgi:hypothetical protein
MTWETFKAAMKMSLKLNDPLLLISGGEPTDHPECLEFIQYAKGTGIHSVMMLSNGMWLTDPAFDDAKRQRILDLVMGVQVTNDPRYYPRRIEQIQHPKVMYETAIRQVAPFGRAKTNGIASTRQSPLCFNLRSFARHTKTLMNAVAMQRQRGSFCTPSVSINGDVLAGESTSCCPIGNVRDSLEILNAGIINLKCNRCGLVDGLSAEQKAAIGEI